MRFDFCIEHIPGKLMYSADTLSRAPVSSVQNDVLASENELESFVAEITASLPASAQRLKTYSEVQANDSVCSALIGYCQSQWSDESNLQTELIKPYWNIRSESTVHHGLLLYCTRIVVPKCLQKRHYSSSIVDTREWKDAVWEPCPLFGGPNFPLTSDRWFRSDRSVSRRVHHTANQWFRQNYPTTLGRK